MLTKEAAPALQESRENGKTRRILVPLDSSGTAEHVLPLAQYLALGLNGWVELFTVVEKRGQRRVEHALDDSYGLSSAKYYLALVAQRAFMFDVRVEIKVIEAASAPEGIIQEAEGSPNTLMVMSTHGRSGLAGWLLGSVAQQVLHGTNVPLVLSRPNEKVIDLAPPQFDSVIVLLDGSSSAEIALPTAVDLAVALGLRVLLVMVTSTTNSAYTPEGLSYGYPYRISIELEDEHEEYLAKKANERRNLGIRDVVTKNLSGDPSRSILDLTEDLPESFVALGVHRRSHVFRRIAPELADRLISRAKVPVLAVRR